MELLAAFTSPPLFAVRHGRNEIGHVPDEVLLTRPTNGVRAILLAGRNWEVLDVDWRRRSPSSHRTNEALHDGRAPAAMRVGRSPKPAVKCSWGSIRRA